MNKETISIIMNYFDEKKVLRKELEKLLDFENLTMEESVTSDISKLLTQSKKIETADVHNEIKEFVRFVKSRSGSGEITWDEFISRLDDAYLEDSRFGIRVQRFSNYSYWEVFFNHYSITECESGNLMLTLDNIWYEDVEKDKAYDTLLEKGIDADLEDIHIFTQIADKWNKLSDDEIDDVISAINTYYRTTEYVDKSRFNLHSKMIDKIVMSCADLVPEVGLRDYHIIFKGGDSVSLRF